MNLRFPQLAGMVILGITFVAAARAGSDNAKKIIGIWENTKTAGKPNVDGARVEFTKDGKLKVVFKQGDKSMTVDGTYKVNDNKVNVVITFAGKSKEDTLIIKKLTDKELFLEDSQGKIEEHKRVK